ncbi:MAG: hypothetical protein KDE51_21215 [Anaerolineales bacterium]|nr:hypothetical protein [Anaerolineales bacterium]
MNLALTDSVIVISITTIITILFTLLTSRARRHAAQVKPHSTFQALGKQVGQAVERGGRLHIGLGRASLNEAAVPTSVAGQSGMSHLVRESAKGHMFPAVTVGDATLLPIAEEALQSGFAAAKRELTPQQTVEFMAHHATPYAYAAGSAYAIQQDDIQSNILLGHFGSEITLMMEAGRRHNTAQIVGSDNPSALAIAAAYTDNILIGEEFLATDAHLYHKPVHIASLYVQNILRAGIIFFIIVTAILQLLSINLADLIG